MKGFKAWHLDRQIQHEYEFLTKLDPGGWSQTSCVPSPPGNLSSFPTTLLRLGSVERCTSLELHRGMGAGKVKENISNSDGRTMEESEEKLRRINVRQLYLKACIMYNRPSSVYMNKRVSDNNINMASCHPTNESTAQWCHWYGHETRKEERGGKKEEKEKENIYLKRWLSGKCQGRQNWGGRGGGRRRGGRGGGGGEVCCTRGQEGRTDAIHKNHH